MTITTMAPDGRTAPSPVADYDAHRRAQARAAGQPIERTAAPAIFGAMKAGAPVDLAMVWTDEAGSLAYFCARETRSPTKLTIAALDRALALPPRDVDDPNAKYADLDQPRRLVVSDHATLRRMMGWVNVIAATAPADDYAAASVHRRLQVSARLVASTRLVVLTRALARKFWLPAQYDPEDFGAWRRAFRYGSGATTLSVMKGLIDLASDGKACTDWANRAFNAESYALMSAAYPGLRPAVAAFRRVETADTAARAILTTDPLMRERGLLDGSVSLLRIMQLAGGQFTATVAQPFKLRAGKSILLVDPDQDSPGEWAESTLTGVTVQRVGGEDTLLVTVAAGGRAKKLGALLEKVMRPGGRRALYVTEAPYLPFSQSDSKATRWTTPTAARIENDHAKGAPRRDIPLDVIVAGAPTA